ncbi:hypothetical protein [Actinoplanes sp. NPDC089786]|uniref:hypothetical protein n=1 Tax=Actinoplanes sp. NPDC089786 TaxID=3155185 RepID=UPI003442BD2D
MPRLLLRRPVAPPAAPALRPDIEGLRALAVLLVVLGHAGLPFLATGPPSDRSPVRPSPTPSRGWARPAVPWCSATSSSTATTITSPARTPDWRPTAWATRLDCDLKYLEPYAEAARTWLHQEAEVIDTTHLTQAQAAAQIVEALEK